MDEITGLLGVAGPQVRGRHARMIMGGVRGVSHQSSLREMKYRRILMKFVFQSFRSLERLSSPIKSCLELLVQVTPGYVERQGHSTGGWSRRLRRIWLRESFDASCEGILALDHT